MLKTLKAQLLSLANTNDGGFEKEVGARVSPDQVDSAVVSLRNFILTMPELIMQIRAWANDPNVPAKDKELHGFLLTYLYHPLDFIPESAHGLFGYLDDAYLVGSIYVMTMGHLDYRTRSSLNGMKEFEDMVPRWLELTRHVIPGETVKVNQLIDELKEGKMDAFFQAVA